MAPGGRTGPEHPGPCKSVEEAGAPCDHCTYFASLNLTALGAAAQLGGAGVWLDVAWEYTERWRHQQHVRDTVGRPGSRPNLAIIA